MDLKNLNTFVHVAETGSFTRAGERLGYSQSAVSIQIKQLETELGFRLFDRIGHTVRLTSRGEETLLYAQRICRMCQEMTLSGSRPHELTGELRLATGDSLCAHLFGSSFSHFREQYPGISLQVTAAGTDTLFDLLDHNGADIVCTLDSHIFHNDYIIAAEERVSVHFVAPAGHPLAKSGPLSVETLLSQPFLLTEKGMSYRRLMDETLARRSLEILPVLEMGRADIICRLVESGMGFSFLPDYVTEDPVRRGTVVRLDVPDCQVEVWAQLLYHRGKWLSPQMEAAIAHLTAALRSIPSFSEAGPPTGAS